LLEEDPMLCTSKSKLANVHAFRINTITRIIQRLLLSTVYIIPLLASNVFSAPIPTTQAGISLDTDWKQKIYAYAQTNVKHSAWGIAHSERDYLVSIALADQEGIKVDMDILFAATFLHDIGAIDPFRKKDVEHSTRSVEIAEPLLLASGFPMQKWPKVKTTILGHMYYADQPTDKEAIVMHDADALDFLGAIGIIRLVSVTERHAWAENLSGALITLHQFKTDLPNKLITNTAKRIALKRTLEMDQFFKTLKQETYDGKLYHIGTI
jgi:uncharacterized protein